MTKYTTISIPEPLYKKIKAFIKDTGFSSASDFVTFVLREIFMDFRERERTRDKKKHIQERLRALGYL